MVETDTARQTVHAEPGTLIHGVSPVLAVPFHDDGALDHAGFDRVVRYVLGCGVSSVMFPGYASEFLKLSTTERWDLYETLDENGNGIGAPLPVCAESIEGADFGFLNAVITQVMADMNPDPTPAAATGSFS